MLYIITPKLNISEVEESGIALKISGAKYPRAPFTTA
jgi:hypothetical protein